MDKLDIKICTKKHLEATKCHFFISLLYVVCLKNNFEIYYNKYEIFYKQTEKMFFVNGGSHWIGRFA